MDQFEVSKQFRFEAAHSLPHLPEGHKCRTPHGHSYMVEISCRGPLNEFGFVVDYADIKKAFEPIDSALDHQDLNEVLDVPTTAENLAKWIYDKISLSSLYQVSVYETPTTCCKYPVK